MKYIVLILSLFFSVAGFGQQQMYLRATAAGGGPVNLLLDDYPGAAAAYSVHKLDKDYVGSCLRVRRDSDNTEQDIGFSGNDLDEASLISFCSGANCFVTTWYDQSGNVNNATQTTAASQPKIYDSSTGIVYDNGIAALEFDGSNDYFALTAEIPASADSTMWGFQVINTQSPNKTVGLGSLSAAAGVYMILGLGNATYINNRSQFKSISSRFYGQQLFSASTDQLLGWQNGNSIGYGAPSNSVRNTNFTAIGRVANDYANQKMQCGIYYRIDQSSNRAAIETIINNYFSIY
jgi:hypothetical protein